MNAAMTADAYKNQQIMTVPPEQLTLMLYNGAIRFVNESSMALAEKNYEKAGKANLRAQDIVREFMETLDMKYELSKNWYLLYEYILHCLITANIHQDQEKLAEAGGMLREFRDTWRQAIKLARTEKAGGGAL